MAIAYCNTTTDLTNVFAEIERYNRKTTLSGTWQSHAPAGANSFKFPDPTGYVEMLFQDGAEMTAVTALPISAGEFYYDAAEDVLYAHASDDGDPTGDTMQRGYDWDNLKATMRNQAQEMLEGFLRSLYVVPFQKVVTPGASYESRLYDYWIIRATALLTCYLIVHKIDPDDPQAMEMYFQVDNPIPEGTISDRPPGIVQRILSGDIALRTARTAREAGGFNIYEGSSNGTTGFATFIEQPHTVTTEQIWKLVIDLGGTPGTATYKLSFDNGTTYDQTGKATWDTNSDDQRVHIGGGIYVRFSGTLVLNDEWTIHIYPFTDKPTVQSVGVMKLDRN